jgi:release factor glutamine methyltransferase
VRDHEPRLALDGGADGFAVFTRLITEAQARLKPGGYLLVEIGISQDEGARQRLVAAGYEVGKTLLDGNKQPRVVVGRRPR